MKYKKKFNNYDVYKLHAERFLPDYEMSIICTMALKIYNKLKTDDKRITTSRFQTFIARKCEAQITKY